MTDTQYLDKALDFIVEILQDDDYICSELLDTQDEEDLCAKNCQGLDRECVLRFLKYYKKGD